MKFEVLKEESVFSGFLTLDKLSVSFERFDGSVNSPVERLVVNRKDAVAALIWNKNTKKVVLVNQFRVPTSTKVEDPWIDEVPAGIIDEGESPEDAIRREVAEELGYELKKIRPLFTFFTSPGASTERIFLFYADISSAQKLDTPPSQDADEDIALREYSLDDIWEGLEHNLWKDAKTLIALQWLRESFLKQQHKKKYIEHEALLAVAQRALLGVVVPELRFLFVYLEGHKRITVTGVFDTEPTELHKGLISKFSDRVVTDMFFTESREEVMEYTGSILSLNGKGLLVYQRYE